MGRASKIRPLIFLSLQTSQGAARNQSISLQGYVPAVASTESAQTTAHSVQDEDPDQRAVRTASFDHVTGGFGRGSYSYCASLLLINPLLLS